MAYSKTSLYGSTPVVSGFLDILRYRPIPFVADDVRYVILSQYNYRPDLLAFDLYEDPELWWVFKSRNPTVIDDPVFDFVAGVEIYIPNINTIRSVVGSV